ncbi:MAG: hypothetical protein QOI80_35, partial [Solirubrobacteraceae bacterium]|nr:hypothetical protein [Solirubrobacteraceae bacterium]
MPRRLARCAPLLILLVLASPASAKPLGGTQAGASPWQSVNGRLPARNGKARVETRPRAFRAFALDRAALEDALAGAPREGAKRAHRSTAIVSIPAPDGTLVRFRTVNSPVMEAGLARRHPDIHTYAGSGVDDPAASVRFDISPAGFHASVRDARGAWYVDPYYGGDQSVYVSYLGDDLDNVHGPLVEPEAIGPAAPRRAGRPAHRAGEEVIQRIYRLAFLTDPSYASYFAGQGVTVAQANAVLINRVNQVYNDDLGIKMMLIASNDAVNLDTQAEFSGANGPCGATACFPSATVSCVSSTLTQNQNAVDTIIGAANYDIGHIGVAAGGGGIASLGVVGQDGVKARGCTGVPTPKGDLYAVDYVAH